MTQKFIADTTEFVDAVDAATEAVANLATACDDAVVAASALGQSLDDVAASANDATGAVDKLQAAINKLHGKDVHVGVNTSAGAAAANAAATNAMADAAGKAAAAERAEGDAAGRTSAVLRLQQAITNDLAAADAKMAATAAVAADATRAHADAFWLLSAAEIHAGTTGDTAAASLLKTAAAATASGTAAGRAWRPWWLFGQNWLTAIHWIVAGSAEILAVVIPALVALGAGMLVAAQGAQNVQQHFTALYAATESTYAAFHQTIGSVVGLGSALQNAQNAANPGVYEILGSAISAAKGHFADFAGAGLQVVHMFDEFAARVNVDLRGALGGQLSAFLAGMVRDLQQLGQVLGNFGHALVNVFAAMPGLVHILLSMLEAVSRFVLVLSSAPAGLLTFGIAIEEVYRWGGLLLGLLVRLAGALGFMTAFATGAGFITRFGAALINLVGVGGQVLTWAGTMIGRLAGIVPAASAAGAAMTTLGGEMRVAASAMSPGMVAGAVAIVAALAFLAIKIESIKTATQQWIANSDQMVAKASDLNKLNTIYTQLGQTTTRLAASQTQLRSLVSASGKDFSGQATGMKVSSQSSIDLANHLISLVGTANTVRGNINLLASQFHVSAAAALALANAAGINLQVGLQKGSLAAKIAFQQINNLRAGLGAMSAPIGVIGADMQAMGVQSQLAASKVGQVNQAMDQFVGTTTAGIGGLAQFESALGSMAKDTQATSVSITGAIRSISRSATAMGYTLQGFGPKAQQSWQQFAQAVQQGNSVLDTFRIGMAEGVVSANQYNTAIKATVGQLLPFTQGNKAAVSMVSQLAQQAGGPATSSLRTLAQWAGVTGNKARSELATGMQQAIIKMSNLNLVARNLSATVAGQLDSAMAGAIVKASGLDQAYLKWAQDVKSNAAPKTLAQDLASIQKEQNFVNQAEQKGTNILNQSTSSALKHAGALNVATGNMNKLATAVGHTSSQIAAHVTKVQQAAGASTAMASKVAQLSANMGNQSTVTARASTAVQALGRQAQTTTTNLHGMGTAEQTAGSNASTAMGKMASLAGSIAKVGSSAAAAAGQVHALASAIAALQSKTITLTVNTVHSSTTIPGHAAGTPSATPGLALVGERGPELVAFGGGERVYPADQTSHILAAMSAQSAGSGGGGMMEVHVHSHAYLDGKEVFNSVKVQTAKYNTRNSGVRTGKLIPS